MHDLSTCMLLLMNFAFMLSLVKMLLKGEVGGHALNSHGNYIADHGKSWNCIFLYFCGNPDYLLATLLQTLVILGTPMVSHFGYSKIIQYSFIWKILAGGLFLFMGSSNPWLLIIYLTFDR